MPEARWNPRPSRISLGLIAGVALLALAACNGGQSTPGQGPAATQGSVSCPPGTPAGTHTASGDRFVGDGLDVTAVASLDPNYGVNGTVDVEVTVSCPRDITDVSTFQSYEAFGSTVGAHLSEIAHQGDTWTFALYADNLSGSQPFQVALYRGALSGSGEPPLTTIVFPWPRSLVRHLAS